jgi:carbamoyl-phosphate synthase small subunit
MSVEHATMASGAATPRLVLEDGTVAHGLSFGAPVSAAGEVVFTTGMVGYPEALTDPSYAGQILVLTFPSIGNYGVPSDRPGPTGLPETMESDRIQVAGLIVADYAPVYSHWEAVRSLSAWLKHHGVPALHDMDTRALTRRLRDRGTMLGKLVVDGDPGWVDPNEENLVARVARFEGRTFGAGGDPHIAVVDCGVKNNIIRCLLRRGARVTVVPWDAPLAELACDGVLLSNGPGDPTRAEATIAHTRALLARGTPVFGICLGCQILALAAGAETFKLRFGHRGQNQPAIELGSQRCFITSQNHGYAIDARSLPTDWKVWFLNANDGSVEGIRHRSLPFSAVQFHPEAACGPVDSAHLFDDFLRTVRAHRVAQELRP